MKNAYMVTFDLPAHLDETFMSLIPRQRFVVNQMMAEGVIQSYSLSNDRTSLWVVMVTDNEFTLMQEIERMPLLDYMTPHISHLMFHNTAAEVMQFSLN
ncbi:MAG: hypothetical protein R2795_02390 [Saprospiraceae bacterium]